MNLMAAKFGTLHHPTDKGINRRRLVTSQVVATERTREDEHLGIVNELVLSTQRMGVVLNLSALTGEEMCALMKFVEETFAVGYADCLTRDATARENFNELGTTDKRLYRPLPQVFVGHGEVAQHDQSTQG